MSKHFNYTPAPWHCESVHPDNGRIQIGSSKDFICEMYKGYDHPDVSCRDAQEPGEQQSQVEQEANARLIAVAPELYEMALQLLPVLKNTVDHPEQYDFLQIEKSRERYEKVLSIISKVKE